MITLVPKTKEALLQIARWQIGVLETPAGSNKQKYGEDYGMNGVSWCVIFVWWCFNEAGFNLRKTASCSDLTSAYKRAGQWVSNGFKPGDIAMFDFSGKKKITEHCGIVVEVGKGYIMTIEGNTSPNNNANGGAVMLRRRENKFVTGVCRPLYNM